MLNKKALSASISAAVEKTYVEDVFSTHIYNGNAAAAGDTNVINNGIDLSGEGGMVWIKTRSNTSAHGIFDTARGTTKSLTSSSAAVEATDSTTLTSFNSNGFTLSTASLVNDSSRIYASWTFRKAAKFFDVVTYSGTGTAKTVNHNLGSVPGVIIVKRTDSADDWAVYHRYLGATKWMFLNSTGASNTGSTPWNDTAPTSTQFTVGTATYTNANGGSYVAYLFAHDETAFGDNGDQSIIKCAHYAGNSSIQSISLGWEPQWLLIKQTNGANNWILVDTQRGINHRSSSFLYPNLTNAEGSDAQTIVPTATGFDLLDAGSEWNADGAVYSYIAIRRPMKTPTDATKVFTPTVYTGTNVDNRLINTTIAPDFVMIRQRNDTVVPGMYTGARLTGNEFLITGSTNAGSSDADSFDAQIVSTVEYGNAFSSMSGVWVGNDATRKFNANTTSNNHIIEAFKRAPGFFDVVCYTGTGANRTVSHNLGVAPEMMIIKSRSAAGAWGIYHANLTSNGYYLLFNNEAESGPGSGYWNSTTPTSSVFSLGTNTTVNSNGTTYVAFLFASCSGVSKVGTYTGNGTNQTINCGFTAGARFVLIKRINTTGDWCAFDTARGIVASSDPFIQLNSTAAEITGEDAVDADNSGFIVNQTTESLNNSNDKYIYLAIA